MAVTSEKKRRSRGSGGLFYSESRCCWVGKYTLGTKPNGKPDVRNVYGKSKAEAQRKLTALIEETKASPYVFVERGTVAEYLLYWLHSIKRLELKDKSFDRLEQTIEADVIPYVGNIQLGALESADVQSMISKLYDNGRSYSTIKKAYDAVNASHKWGLSVKPPKVKLNPCSGVKLPSKKNFKPSKVRFYTQDEALQISKAAMNTYKCGTPHYPLGGAIVLVLNTGIRLGELIALEWDRDIDLENRILTVHHNVVRVKDRSKNAKRNYIVKEQEIVKTDAGQDREIPLNDMAMKALYSLRSYTGKFKYVVATRDGNRKTERDIDKMLRRVILRAGFPEEKVYGLHSLRHTFATMMLSNDVEKVDIKTVSRLLGHSSVSVTYNTYIHVIKSQMTRATAALPNVISF